MTIGKKKSKIITKKVSFELSAPEAQKVDLSGDFNNWDASVHSMKKDKKGV